jgi:Sulfate permease family
MSDSTPFFRPKLLECLRGYSTRQFFADLTAGLTVGIVALPLAMAFAIASGVKPEAGIFTAVIAGFNYLRARRLARTNRRPNRRIYHHRLRHPC